jgi:ketosteroid isomerase-like protein
MSQENVEVMRGMIDGYNRGDFDAMFKHAAPDAEVDMSRAVGPAHGVYSIDQCRRVIEEFVDNWESARIEPHEFMEVGEHVVVPITGKLVGRDGIEVEARTTWVWTIRDGAVQRGTMYQERADALEAAGLSE